MPSSRFSAVSFFMLNVTECGIKKLNGDYSRTRSSETEITDASRVVFTHVRNSKLRIQTLPESEVSQFCEPPIDGSTFPIVWALVELLNDESDSEETHEFLVHYACTSQRLLCDDWWAVGGIAPMPVIVAADFDLASQWSKYPSIENEFNASNLATIQTDGHWHKQWVATEKVHGANFAILSDGSNVVAAKRTSVLKESDRFYYGWKQTVAKETDKVHALFEAIRSEVASNVKCITVFGELFGGEFPGIKASDSRIRKVQKGVYYSPEIHFYPFDIKVTTRIGAVAKGCNFFVDFQMAVALFERVGFEIFAKPLLICSSLDKIITEFDPESFETTIPQRLGVVEETKADDCESDTAAVIHESTDDLCIAEGAVIRLWTGGHRMLKYKADAFAETQRGKLKLRKRKRIDLSAFTGDLGEIKRQFRNLLVDTLSAKLRGSADEIESGKVDAAKRKAMEMVETIDAMVNENRLDSTVSKFGPLSNENKGAVKGALIGDVLKDARKEYSPEFSAFSKTETRELGNYLNSCITEFMVAFIQQIPE